MEAGPDWYWHLVEVVATWQVHFSAPFFVTRFHLYYDWKLLAHPQKDLVIANQEVLIKVVALLTHMQRLH